MRTFGKFRLLEPLASGGMADVWRAEVTLAAGVVKEVALKLIRGEHQAHGDFVRMFVEEARLACLLSHANVVQVFEFDQVEGQYYLSMELVRGRHLGRVVERAREVGLRLGLPRTVHLIAEAAKALAYVHRLTDGGRPLGLVHRDVSPHNLLLSFEGEVKLADFGIARAMSLAGLTEPGTLKGKIAYMAPEQASGEPVDARADVFSLGVILWELCAGRRLFARDSEGATLAAVLSGPSPSPPSGWNEAVPPELDGIVLAALERDPARRTSSAEELERLLSALLLRMARTPLDWDLRSFMHRLWPEGATPPPSGLLEETRVRPAQPARAQVTSATAQEAVRASPAEATAATLTLARPRAGRWRLAVLAAAAGIAAVSLATVAPRWRAAANAAKGAPASGVSAPARQAPSVFELGPALDLGSIPSFADPTAAPEDATLDAGLGSPTSEPDAHSPGPEDLGVVPAEGTDERRDPTVDLPGRDLSRDEGARGEGAVYVRVTPWAQVFVDGRFVGETPVEVHLPAGRHRLRAVHPTYGSAQAWLVVRAGRSQAWSPALQRE